MSSIVDASELSDLHAECKSPAADGLPAAQGEPVASVLVVDSHPIVVEGVRHLLDAAADLAIVGSASCRQDALAAAEALQPDLIVLDVELGAELEPLLVRSLLLVAPEAQIVVHTAVEVAEPLRASLACGASAVVAKYGQDLVPTLRRVLAGGDIDGCAEHEPPSIRTGEGAGIYESLTIREYEILCVIALGRTSAEAASELHLATNTVRSYTQTLLKKLHARNRIEAVAIARRLRIL